MARISHRLSPRKFLRGDACRQTHSRDNPAVDNWIHSIDNPSQQRFGSFLPAAEWAIGSVEIRRACSNWLAQDFHSNVLWIADAQFQQRGVFKKLQPIGS